VVRWLLVALLVACRTDPQLDPFARSLAEWEAGREALDAGEPGRAAEAFARARAADPSSTTLPLWEARARAAGGDLDGAVALLDELLRARPGVAEARYNRAAYLARQGRPEAGRDDLRLALAADVATPYAAAADPDFAPHRAGPVYAGLLPPTDVTGSVAGPDGPVFLGSVVEVKLNLEALARTPILLRRDGPDPGCLHLDRLLEDDLEHADVRLRQLTLRMTATAPCEVELGPFVAGAGGVEVELGRVKVQVEAPPGAAGRASVLPATLFVPSDHAPVGAEVRTVAVADGTLALGPLRRTLVADGRRPEWAVEWRVNGQTRATGGWWPGTVTVDADLSP